MRLTSGPVRRVNRCAHDPTLTAERWKTFLVRASTFRGLNTPLGPLLSPENKYIRHHRLMGASVEVDRPSRGGSCAQSAYVSSPKPEQFN